MKIVYDSLITEPDKIRGFAQDAMRIDTEAFRKEQQQDETRDIMPQLDTSTESELQRYRKKQ
jgi:hypothetical protein